MITASHLAADLAADRTRTLLAEAEAYRLARQVAPTRAAPTRRRGWAQLWARVTAPRHA